ncbi:cuticle protein AMP1A-like [Palaemon carinicauda]|uniref:cuticle protein AMP1A-like n=1 Tax=Palaemon carinicauda TaxID=392227 RepID=UPI0035B6A4A7
MKFVILAALATVALAAPQYSYDAPAGRSSADSSEEVAILRDDRVHEDDGKYNFDFESENGIRFSESGSPDGNEDAIVSAGQYSYTAPDGTEVVVKYVADENGFQPQSDLLPVAPEFPHPIPQFVLDQIAFAAEEDARRARGGDSREAPSRSYGAPQ